MDYFKVPYIAYVILIICVVIISFLKLLLSNKLILHTLHKKNYGGNFSIIKASLISLLTEVLVILIPLAFFTLIIMSINHSSVDIVAFFGRILRNGCRLCSLTGRSRCISYSHNSGGSFCYYVFNPCQQLYIFKKD